MFHPKNYGWSSVKFRWLELIANPDSEGVNSTYRIFYNNFYFIDVFCTIASFPINTSRKSRLALAGIWSNNFSTIGIFNAWICGTFFDVCTAILSHLRACRTLADLIWEVVCQTLASQRTRRWYDVRDFVPFGTDCVWTFYDLKAIQKYNDFTFSLKTEFFQASQHSRFVLYPRFGCSICQKWTARIILTLSQTSKKLNNPQKIFYHQKFFQP